MEARNLRQPGVKRNQSSDRLTSIKEGAATKLSGLSIRGRGRAPLAEISISNRENTNSHINGGPIITGKAGVSILGGVMPSAVTLINIRGILSSIGNEAILFISGSSFGAKDKTRDIIIHQSGSVF